MSDVNVERIARLLRERNSVDEKISSIIQRPVASGHLGDWIAAQVFGIELEPSTVTSAIDGRFSSGPLRGQTVNVKWYLKREGLLDVTERPALDFYLVLTGPASRASSSRGGTRPWCIESVYLFDARRLLAELRARGVRIGTASSVLAAQWAAAEIYPRTGNPALPVRPEQAELLRLFAP
ncbi:hypothetical protein ACFQVD_27950 [Streptosporangium amethystogenes subsp. fukuiense]|uniref:Restriction endonuclease n=1 Tax=Streptosporangium amethystogenes subsp. fukuiense TaxID=698418 RepID=A0ABW2T5K1_9ACTN